MSGFCSAHRYHDPKCHICESADISPAEREVMTLAQEIAVEQRAYIGWMEPNTDPRPTAHKSIHDYQQQLKAKRKRKKR